LSAAEGHPASVMDMSFSTQALACEWVVKNGDKLKPKVYNVTEEIEKEVAELKLKSMGIVIDKLTKEQKKYLESWQEGHRKILFVVILCLSFDKLDVQSCHSQL